MYLCRVLCATVLEVGCAFTSCFLIAGVNSSRFPVIIICLILPREGGGGGGLTELLFMLSFSFCCVGTSQWLRWVATGCCGVELIAPSNVGIFFFSCIFVELVAACCCYGQGVFVVW